MAKYLVLNSATWVHATNTAATALQQRGAVIGFLGLPGVSLFPLDDEARAARLEVIRTRNYDQRENDELQIRRLRAALPLLIQETLDAAMVEFEAFIEAQQQKARTR